MSYENDEYQQPSVVTRVAQMTQFTVLCVLLTLVAVFNLITLFNSYGTISIIINLITTAISVTACVGAWLISRTQSAGGFKAVRVIAIIKRIGAIILIAASVILLIIMVIMSANNRASFGVILFLIVIMGLVIAYMTIISKYYKGIINILNHASSSMQYKSFTAPPRGLAKMAIILGVLSSITVIISLTSSTAIIGALSTGLGSSQYGRSSELDAALSMLFASGVISTIAMFLPPLQFFMVWSCAKVYESSTED